VYDQYVFFYEQGEYPNGHTLTGSLELCQVLVSHFVTLTEDSAAPDSESSRIVVQRLEEIFCDMEEIMVSVL
jgi:hypothetical protein